MILKALYSYIENNSTFQSVNRATIYFPQLVDRTFGEFVFECMGTHINPYEVRVNIKSDPKISSNCSCPYEEEGICKHQIAAINTIIEMIKTKEIDADELILSLKNQEKKSDPKSSITNLPHDKGVLDIDAINKMKFSAKPYYYSRVEFKTVTRKKVTAIMDNYREVIFISLEYFPKKDELALNCTCNSSSACFHKLAFLQDFVEDFTAEYFSPNFKDLIKKRTLQEKNLEGLVNFDDVFELNVSKEGIDVKQLVPNIVVDAKAPLKLVNDEPKGFFVPKVYKKQKVSFALGFCLEKYQGEIVSAYPFYGKLNKSKTEIVSKFEVIEEHDYTTALELVNDNDASAFITKSIQLNNVFRRAAYNGFEVDDIRKLIANFSSLIPYLDEKTIFVRDSSKSFIRKNVKELSFSNETVTPILKIKENNSFYQLDFKVKVNDKKHLLSSKKVKVLPFGIIIGDVFYPTLNPEISANLLEAAQKKQINLYNRGLDHLRKTVIDPLSAIFEIEFSGIKETKRKPKSDNVEKHVYLSDEEGEYVVLQPLVKYGEKLVPPGGTDKVWADEAKLSYLKRDAEAEQNFLELIKNLHPTFENKTGYFYLSVENALESMWLMETIEQLKSSDIRIFGLNELKSIQYNLNKPTFSIGLSSGTDWFDMDLDVQFGDQKVDLRELQKSIVKKSNYVELKDGTIGILPKEWIEKYKKYFKLGQIKKDKIEISNYQFNIIDELYEDLTNTPTFLEELYEKKKRLANLKDLKPIPKPKNLKATLRPYQKEGLNWLVFLDENKLGGCLADDMGLGKTIQTIAFIQYLKNNAKGKKLNPHLIVAPTSLIFNWIAELEKFAPKLKVLPFIGAQRDDLKKEIAKQDVILTTYGSLIKDIEFHKEKKYNYVVLDESQAIKNPQSQRFKAVRLLNSENRLALTGTPIENNTFDLYSQFNFLNPGIFGSIKHFKSTFSDAIDKEQDQSVSDLLARMISPFLLRRTKSQVAKELPSKTEGVIYCEMGANQRKVYDHFKQYFREKLAEQIENEGVNKSQMYILQGLTKLRQICNSTALADKDKDYGADSSKLDELTRHLNEKVNNHKVLVFSQFVGMLKIVQERLDSEGIKYEYLDGQTRNREEKVNNFQNDPEIRVFLISLKAGGTGLNLTEADYVYLIDPWWNPAVESQAIDRCYRIGQDKKVMAYRMICKDTIEEKIVQLQNKKKTVASEVIRIDKEKKTFDKKDVELFFGTE